VVATAKKGRPAVAASSPSSQTTGMSATGGAAPFGKASGNET
jgi:hypothetical protein